MFLKLSYFRRIPGDKLVNSPRVVVLCLRGRAGPRRSLTLICSLSKIIEIKDAPLS